MGEGQYIKTFGDIVSFAKANLNSNTSEPNLQN